MNKNLVFLFLIGSFFYVGFADGEEVGSMLSKEERYYYDNPDAAEARLKRINRRWRREQEALERRRAQGKAFTQETAEAVATGEFSSTAWCEVLNTSFYGSHGVQVQCGEGPEKIGWISNNAQLQKIVLKVRDKDTGQERKVFLRTNPNRPGVGGTKETLTFNQEGSEGNNSLPISLYIPGGCGSSKIFHAVTLGSLKDNDELKEDEECSWLNENDTNWRSAIKGIKENENIVSIRYGLHPDTPVYSDQEGNEQKGEISEFRDLTSFGELRCENVGKNYIIEGNKERGFSLSLMCRYNGGAYFCVGEKAICSNGRGAYFEFPEYGCKGPCPTLEKCIFGEDSFYFNKAYYHFITNDSSNEDVMLLRKTQRKPKPKGSSRGVR